MALQSGKAKTLEWLLEFEPASARLPDPLMGWAQSHDMNGQVRLNFDTRDEAIAYAQSHAIPFQVMEPKPIGQPCSRPMPTISPSPARSRGPTGSASRAPRARQLAQPDRALAF